MNIADILWYRVDSKKQIWLTRTRQDEANFVCSSTSVLKFNKQSPPNPTQAGQLIHTSLTYTWPDWAVLIHSAFDGVLIYLAHIMTCLVITKFMRYFKWHLKMNANWTLFCNKEKICIKIVKQTCTCQTHNTQARIETTIHIHRKVQLMTHTVCGQIHFYINIKLLLVWGYFLNIFLIEILIKVLSSCSCWPLFLNT